MLPAEMTGASISGALLQDHRGSSVTKPGSTSATVGLQDFVGVRVASFDVSRLRYRNDVITRNGSDVITSLP